MGLQLQQEKSVTQKEKDKRKSASRESEIKRDNINTFVFLFSFSFSQNTDFNHQSLPYLIVPFIYCFSWQPQQGPAPRYSQQQAQRQQSRQE